MDGVGTSIIERSQPLPGHDTPTPSIMKSPKTSHWQYLVTHC